MRNRLESLGDSFVQDRLVVIGNRMDHQSLVRGLRRQYPNWHITTCDSYLSSIVEVSRTLPRAVLACIEPAPSRWDRAVTALREAAPHTRIVLCCTPASEPIAREGLTCGADDYVLLPLDEEEMDAALGYVRLKRIQTLSQAVPETNEELVQLGEALACLPHSPHELIEKLARLVATATGAGGVTVVVEGATATSGTPVVHPALTSAIQGSQGVIGQLTLGERDGAPYTRADMDKLAHYATLAGHLLQAASQHRQWRHDSVTDECSGLPNRRYLRSRLDEILARAAQERFSVTLLLFDVDNFKSYNDRFGHAAGDEIIRIIGDLFQQKCREQDIVARYGGDEFAVVFWDAQGVREAGSSHPGCALAVLGRFNQALRTQEFPTLGSSAGHRLTISGGLATYPWDGDDKETLIERADQALLAAKRAGKNRVFIIGTDLDARPASP